MNRLLRFSLVGSVGVHLAVFTAGGALAPRFHTDAPADRLRAIDVELETPEPPPVVEPPAPDPPAPEPPTPTTEAPTPTAPAPMPTPTPAPAPTPPVRTARATPTAPPTAPLPARPDPNPGGALNLGTASEHGDVEGLPTGQTPVGWVPGSDTGKGIGSGEAEGIGLPEPVTRPVPPPPEPVAPTPLPQPTPPPKRVSVRVCADSSLRPNSYCPRVVAREFVEGAEPAQTCGIHKPPPPKADPQPPRPTPVPPRPHEEPRLTPARLVRQVEPRYPEAARDSNREGSVLVEVRIQANGRAGEVTVAHSSGSRLLDTAAVNAVKQWRWEPARRGDAPIESTARYRVRFVLEE